jgi:hypothetical protein
MVGVLGGIDTESAIHDASNEVDRWIASTSEIGYVSVFIWCSELTRYNLYPRYAGMNCREEFSIPGTPLVIFDSIGFAYFCNLINPFIYL